MAVAPLTAAAHNKRGGRSPEGLSPDYAPGRSCPYRAMVPWVN
jgi:hypothetical protein